MSLWDDERNSRTPRHVTDPQALAAQAESKNAGTEAAAALKEIHNLEESEDSASVYMCVCSPVILKDIANGVIKAPWRLYDSSPLFLQTSLNFLSTSVVLQVFQRVLWFTKFS